MFSPILLLVPSLRGLFQGVGIIYNIRMNRFEPKERQAETDGYQWIEEATDMGSLKQALEKYGTITGGNGTVYSAGELIELMRRIQDGRGDVIELTRTGGLREKFEELTGIKEISKIEVRTEENDRSESDELYRGLKVGDMIKHPWRDEMTPVLYRGTEIYKFISAPYVKKDGEWPGKFIVEAIKGSEQYKYLMSHDFLSKYARNEPSVELDFSYETVKRSIVVPVSRLELPGRLARFFKRKDRK